MDIKNNELKRKRMRIGVGIAIAAGLISLGSLIASVPIKWAKETSELYKEIDAKGYAHISPTRINYNNGYEAESFDDNSDGLNDRVVVDTFSVFDRGSFGEDKDKTGRLIYNKGDPGFSEIERNIREESPPYFDIRLPQ